MKPKDYLSEQLKRHPSSTVQDMLKQSYQAAFGAEHLMGDGVRDYFDAEFAAVTPREGELAESISERVCRVYLDVWKGRGLPSEWLYRLFARSRFVGEPIAPWLDAAYELMPEQAQRIADYRLDPCPVHHSQSYREGERPAYRLVSRDLCRLIPILENIGRVIAIDGPAASGKTTLAAELAEVIDGAVVHMDDFFLPLPLRTPERMREVGGNVDYERFAAQVLPRLREDAPFSYPRFDCSRMALGEERQVAAGYRIVEGSYSCHPRFGEYADLRVFCELDKDEQERRIRRRNPDMAERFFGEWIPMEDAYFEAFGIRERALNVKNEYGKK